LIHFLREPPTAAPRVMKMEAMRIGTTGSARESSPFAQRHTANKGKPARNMRKPSMRRNGNIGARPGSGIVGGSWGRRKKKGEAGGCVLQCAA
jgi:hypothetical protein